MISNINEPCDRPVGKLPVALKRRWHRQYVSGIAMGGLCCTLAVVAGYWMGRERDASPTRLLPLAASTADSSDTMAMATGSISEDVEGVFFIDFNTGDLQCLVYYPRSGAFGAHFYTNVRQQLGSGGKNSKYLIATGHINSRANTAGGRPASSLVYITDTTTGLFAAYVVPWDPTAEASGRPQGGALLFAGGGPIRNYQLANPPGGANAAPPAIVDPNANNPARAGGRGNKQN